MKRQRTAILLAVLLLASCAAMPLRQGAVNRADDSAYSVLLITQAVIDQVRAEIAAGSLPEGLRPGLMRLIDSYNIARSAWLTYRNAVKAGTSPSATAINAAVSGLSTALDAFQSSRSITP